MVLKQSKIESAVKCGGKRETRSRNEDMTRCVKSRRVDSNTIRIQEPAFSTRDLLEKLRTLSIYVIGSNRTNATRGSTGTSSTLPPDLTSSFGIYLWRPHHSFTGSAS
jgi:hypothetical protein